LNGKDLKISSHGIRELGNIWNSVPENYTILCTIIVCLDSGYGIWSENDRATIKACRVESSIDRLRKWEETRFTSVQITWIVEEARKKGDIEGESWSRWSRRI
jgi:hypothetical protein